MKVNGDISPDIIHIEKSATISNYGEIRLRENINRNDYFDEANGQTVSKYEYDEYIFCIPYREGLHEEIEANFDDWIATGRTLEQNTQASAYVDLRTALAILGVNE